MTDTSDAPPPYSCCGPFPSPYFSETPHPDLPIVYPDNIVIFPDTVIRGYWIHNPPSTQACIVPPKPSRLSMEGWFACVFLGLLCWPLCGVPCIMASCYDGYQVAVMDCSPR